MRKPKNLDYFNLKPINGQVDRASAIETIDSGFIPSRVKPKTINIGVHRSQLLCMTFSNKTRCSHASAVCNRQLAAQLEKQKVHSLSPGQANLVNKRVIAIIIIKKL